VAFDRQQKARREGPIGLRMGLHQARIPPLRGPARQNSARKRKPGLSGRDDRIELRRLSKDGGVKRPEHGRRKSRSLAGARDDKVRLAAREESLAIAVGDGFRDDADVGDAGLAKFVDDSGEDAERNGLVGAEEDGVVGTLELLFDARGKLVDVHGIVAEIDELVFVDGDDNFLLDEGLDRFRFGDVDFDAGLEDGSGDHEDDEKNEDDIDERDHVDVGKGGLRGFGELGHGVQRKSKRVERCKSERVRGKKSLQLTVFS